MYFYITSHLIEVSLFKCNIYWQQISIKNCMLLWYFSQILLVLTVVFLLLFSYLDMLSFIVVIMMAWCSGSFFQGLSLSADFASWLILMRGSENTHNHPSEGYRNSEKGEKGCLKMNALSVWWLRIFLVISLKHATTIEGPGGRLS